MHLNDLLLRQKLQPHDVLVVRHRPFEIELNKVLPLLAAEDHDAFNAYQQCQREKLEKTLNGMMGTGYLASFIAHGPGRALFIGLYKIEGARRITQRQYWAKPENQRLKLLGMTGLEPHRPSAMWFDLSLTDFYKDWKGKLVVDWPPPERSWWRRAHKNQMAVRTILEESALQAPAKDWRDINLTWNELTLLSSSWKARLSEWRAIYYIFDVRAGKGYVGSASGNENLLGRWLNYAATGHGGNKLLRKNYPGNFRFSILERVSPDMEKEEVIRLENSWKERLHSRAPVGLNEN